MNLVIIEDSSSKGWRLTLGDKIRTGKYRTSSGVDKDARYFGVDSNWLQRCLDQGAGEYEVPGVEPALPAGPEPVYIRGLRDKGRQSLEVASIEQALQRLPGLLAMPEPLIYWESMERLCAVDVDFHHLPYDRRPTAEYLKTRFVDIQPAPRFLWVTHGRGLRLIYLDAAPFTAWELAAAAAVRVLKLEGNATIELKKITRHPHYPNGAGRMCSPVETRTQTTDLSAVLAWQEGHADYNEEELDEWLQSRGLEIGQRYEHDKCPADPGTPSHGMPVVVYGNGVFCHGCHGHGVRRGSKTPGWFPFQVFLGHPDKSIIARCLENFTHWEHARFVLAAHFQLSDTILRGAYSALLKHRHGTDPRCGAVFAAGDDIIRYNQRWGSLSGESYQTNHTGPMLAKLPACQFVDETGKVKVDAERVARFLQPTSLERYGYPYIQPVYGHPIYSVYQTPKHPYQITVCKGRGQAPRYIPLAQRMQEDEAWNWMYIAFPGLNRQAVELLLAAKGCAEGDGTFSPFVFITGPTKSAKSTSVAVAAAIAGDRVSSVRIGTGEERIFQAIQDAKDTGSYVVFNEAVKEGARRRVSKAESMEFALSLTSDVRSHRLYVGSIEMGTLPVFVWTDTYIPPEVKHHAQLARRFIHVALPSKVDWHTSMKETGIGKAEWLRAASERRYVEAADAILSYVIDRHFKVPTTFEEIANKLGFATLEESREAREQISELQTFYELVEQAPKVQGEVLIDPNGASPLSQLWRELADPPDWRSSQRCTECDWQQVLGASGPVFARISPRRSRVRVAFEGITDGSVLRYRNPVGGRPEGGGVETVYFGPLDALDDARAEDRPADAGLGSALRDSDSESALSGDIRSQDPAVAPVSG